MGRKFKSQFVKAPRVTSQRSGASQIREETISVEENEQSDRLPATMVFHLQFSHFMVLIKSDEHCISSLISNHDAASCVDEFLYIAYRLHIASDSLGSFCIGRNSFLL